MFPAGIEFHNCLNRKKQRETTDPASQNGDSALQPKSLPLGSAELTGIGPMPRAKNMIRPDTGDPTGGCRGRRQFFVQLDIL